MAETDLNEALHKECEHLHASLRSLQRVLDEKNEDLSRLQEEFDALSTLLARTEIARFELEQEFEAFKKKVSDASVHED